MKKILTIALLTIAFAANAQQVTQGSLDFMKNVKAITLEFNFNDAYITDANMNVLEWGVEHDKMYHRAEGVFNAELQTACERELRTFADRAAKKMKDIQFVWNGNAPVKMTMQLRATNKRGQHANADYIFTDTTTGQVLAIINCETKGGRYGGYANLLDDCLKSAFGKVINMMDNAHKK